MVNVYVGIGSNVNRYYHIAESLDALQNTFGRLFVSSVYESKSVGFVGSNFLNLVVGFSTACSVDDLQKILKSIEDDNGRIRSGPKFSARTLDIDILTYGQKVGLVDGVLLPREEILQNAFVLKPLVDIAAEDIHPVVSKNYGELWANYDKYSQQLWTVDFEWQGQVISKSEG